MSVQENKDLVRRYFDALNQHRSDLDEFLAPSFVPHYPIPGYPADLAGQKQGLQSFFTAFPDVKFEIENLIAEGDLVVVQARVLGTHQGPLWNVQATGKPVSFPTTAIYRVQNGAIVESWVHRDVYEMLRQIGAVASPLQSQERGA